MITCNRLVDVLDIIPCGQACVLTNFGDYPDNFTFTKPFYYPFEIKQLFGSDIMKYYVTSIQVHSISRALHISLTTRI